MIKAAAASILLLLTFGSTMAHAQTPPFTEEELYQAFRMMVEPSEARSMARDALSTAQSASSEHPAAGSLAFQPEPVVQLTDDTLVILSLLSEDLRARVERFRRGRHGRPFTPAEEQAWAAHRAQMQSWVAARTGEARR